MSPAQPKQYHSEKEAQEWTDKQSYDYTDDPESHFERKLDNAKDHVE